MLLPPFFVLVAESLASLVDKKCSGGFLAGGKKIGDAERKNHANELRFGVFFLSMVFMESTAESCENFCYLARVLLGVKVK